MYGTNIERRIFDKILSYNMGTNLVVPEERKTTKVT
jgi:hypothetical protein